MKLIQTPVGAALAANTGAVGASHGGGGFAGKPAPTGYCIAAMA
ncbi:diguanylate cyclase [Pseudomonas sp. Leaf58]|nr:diguanylate cyclase [Pseudomonas sp. Leaf58]